MTDKTLINQILTGINKLKKEEFKGFDSGGKITIIYSMENIYFNKGLTEVKKLIKKIIKGEKYGKK